MGLLPDSKIAGCACAGNSGKVPPATDWLAIPTCITAPTWSTRRNACRWRGKISRHSRRMRNPQFYISDKRSMIEDPLLINVYQHIHRRHIMHSRCILHQHTPWWHIMPLHVRGYYLIPNTSFIYSAKSCLVLSDVFRLCISSCICSLWHRVIILPVSTSVIMSQYVSHWPDIYIQVQYSIATGHADMPCFTCVYAISMYLADLFPDLHHHQQTWWHNMLITIMALQPRYNYRAYYGFAQLLHRYYNFIISKDDTGPLLMVLS